MNASAEVVQAQAALNAAMQRQKDERRAQLVGELEQVTKRLEQERDEYAGLRERVLQLRAKRSGLQNALSELLGQEAEHAASKPRIADHLPDAPSVVKWRQAGERLESQRCAITAALAETSAVSQMDRDLARLVTEIQRLEFAQHNLTDALESMKVKPFLNAVTEPPSGGLARVTWR